MNRRKKKQPMYFKLYYLLSLIIDNFIINPKYYWRLRIYQVYSCKADLYVCKWIFWKQNTKIQNKRFINKFLIWISLNIIKGTPKASFLINLKFFIATIGCLLMWLKSKTSINNLSWSLRFILPIIWCTKLNILFGINIKRQDRNPKNKLHFRVTNILRIQIIPINCSFNDAYMVFLKQNLKINCVYWHTFAFNF